MQHEAAQHVINWGWPTWSMPTTICSGSACVTIWNAVFQLIITVGYWLICRQFKANSRLATNSPARENFNALLAVFFLCSLSGYTLDAIKATSSTVATLATWAGAMVLPLLAKQTFRLLSSLKSGGSTQLERHFEWAQQLEEIANSQLVTQKLAVDIQSTESRVLSLLAELRAHSG